MAAATACSRKTAGAAAVQRTRKLGPIGIQLYTVRSQMRADMAGTLAAIAKIGYKEVEFAGFFGRPATEVKAMLTANNLSAPSAHVGYDELVANWDRVFDDASTLGFQFLTVPSPPNRTASTVAAWQRVADNFSAAGERAKARGITLAYHNHGSELRAMEGTSALEILLTRADPKYVAMQMDVFWTVSGGGDPMALFRRFPDRFVMLHIKDSSGGPNHTQVDVGAGTIDFAAILALDASQKGSVKHVFVEHDQPADPMLFAKSAFEYLSKLEY
jgi:sugar phosphate isomerase/epimerase